MVSGYSIGFESIFSNNAILIMHRAFNLNKSLIAILFQLEGDSIYYFMCLVLPWIYDPFLMAVRVLLIFQTKLFMPYLNLFIHILGKLKWVFYSY